MATLHRALSSFFVTTVLFACSSTEATSDEASFDRIDPTGTETMASVTLQLPTGACLAGGSCAHPLASGQVFLLDTTAMTLGSPVRVPAGAHTLNINGTSLSLALVAGSARTIVLPVVHRACTNASIGTIPTTQFGPVPTLGNATCPAAVVPPSSVDYFHDDGSCTGAPLAHTDTAADCATPATTTAIWGLRVNGRCSDIGDSTFAAVCGAIYTRGASSLSSNFSATATSLLAETALAPGAYTFTVDSNAGPTVQTRSASEGGIDTWNFDLPVLGTVPSRFGVNVTFAGTHDFANAAATTITSNCERPYTFPAGTAPLALQAFRFDTCGFHLDAGGRTLPLSQTSDNNVRLYRIDVADVNVTREDGSHFTTRGTYEVYFGGTRVAGPFATSTGIDALAGDYEVVVQYSTALGAQTNRYNVHF